MQRKHLAWLAVLRSLLLFFSTHVIKLSSWYLELHLYKRPNFTKQRNSSNYGLFWINENIAKD